MLAARAVLLALLFVPFIAWWRVDNAHHDYYVGADAYNEGDVDTAIRRLRDAVNRDSSNMVYRLLLGQALAQGFRDSGGDNTGLIREAIVNLEQARRLDPRSDIARANLARAYELDGRDDDAAVEAKLTRLAGNHVPPVLAVAEVYEDLGREEDAISTYGQVLSMDASLANSEFWELTPWRRDHLDEIIEASILGLNPCTFGSYLVEQSRESSSARRDDIQSSEEGCKLLLFSAPNDLVLRVALARIQSALGNREDALGHLRYAVDRQPDFGPARTELGRWYAADGDLDAARHEWVIGERLDEPESVMLLGESYRPQDRPAYLEGRLRDLLGGFGSSVQNDVVSVLYYRIRYGRLSPVFAIIPATWQTAVPRVYADMRATLARWESEE
jgi:tetratricopeptide (TPR) repeat protein